MSADQTTTLLTITSLIDQLVTIRAGHGDLPVLVSGYEEGLDKPSVLEVVSVFDRGAAEKEDRWWNGRFALDRDRYDEETAPAFDAVVIPR